MILKAIKTRIKRLVLSIGRRKLLKSFETLGLKKGALVCTHSSLSRLGYIEGGPSTVIDALMDTVTQKGCVAMPTFSMSGTMKDYLDNVKHFDLGKTPSQVGRITEIFRSYPGVVRSLHPTHSVAAWGDGAVDLIKDHNNSITPFGLNTPYGRLAEHDDGFILMFGTRLLSLPHHLQERTDFPNLFLPDMTRVSLVDAMGNETTMETKVLRPKIPFRMAIPSVSGEEPDWCLLHDFCLLFPPETEEDLRQKTGAKGYPKMWGRRAALEKLGILRTAKLGRGEIGLLRVKPYVQLILPEMADLIARFRSFYPKCS